MMKVKTLDIFQSTHHSAIFVSRLSNFCYLAIISRLKGIARITVQLTNNSADISEN